MLANTQAAAPAAAGLPAGQRCFVSHQQHIQRQHRPRLAAAAARGPVAAAAAAAQVLPSCGGRRQLLLAAGLLAAGPAVSWQVAAEEAAGSSRQVLPLPLLPLHGRLGVGPSAPALCCVCNQSPRHCALQVFFDITVDRKPLGRIVIEASALPAPGRRRQPAGWACRALPRMRRTAFSLLPAASAPAAAAMLPPDPRQLPPDGVRAAAGALATGAGASRRACHRRPALPGPGAGQGGRGLPQDQV